MFQPSQSFQHEYLFGPNSPHIAILHLDLKRKEYLVSVLATYCCVSRSLLSRIDQINPLSRLQQFPSWGKKKTENISTPQRWHLGPGEWLTSLKRKFPKALEVASTASSRAGLSSSEGSTYPPHGSQKRAGRLGSLAYAPCFRPPPCPTTII